MGRRTADVEINTFVRGLITEASPLTFPENASLSEVNFVLNRDGSRQRRLGMEYETGAVLRDTLVAFDTESDIAISSFVWKGANGDGSLDILVVQVRRDLYFFDNTREIISENLLMTGGFENINEFGFSSIVTTESMGFGIGNGVLDFSFTTVQKNLIVVDEKDHFHIVTYDEDTDSMVNEFKKINTRDVWSLALPDLPIDDRPTLSELSALTGPDGTSLLSEYYYIMANQGWATRVKNTDGIVKEGVFFIRQTTGNFPSRASILGASKDSAGALSVDAFDKQVVGTTPAPIGNVVLDSAFDRGGARNRADPYGSTISNVYEDRTEGSISSLATYAGRVFYGLKETKLIGGDRDSPRLGTLIFFSKVVTSKSDIQRCYSIADPTSEDTPGLVDSDGGFVAIPDVGEVLQLVPLENSLFVIGSQGVWEIHGGDKPFSATNQTVDKVTSAGSLSGSTAIVAESTILYWSESGIYSIAKDAVSLRGKATNVSVGTIQSFYEAIPTINRARSSVVYDPVSRQVRWQYGEGLDIGRTKNKELILDIDLQAFYTSTISTTSSEGPYLIGPINLASTIFNTTTDNVVVGSDNIVVGSLNVVASGRTVDETVKGSVKYLSLAKNSSNSKWFFSVSHYREATFKDWKIHDSVGTDAKATLLTGFLTAGVASKDKKTPYLVTHCKLTEEGFTDDGLGNLTPIGESSCLVQAQWEWTDSDAPGRWGPIFQAYRLPRYFGATGATDPFDYGFTVVTTKSKLRGKGRALSLLFETEAEKDLHLFGWGHTLNIENKS